MTWWLWLVLGLVIGVVVAWMFGEATGPRDGEGS